MSRTHDLENFATSTVELVDNTYDGRRNVAVYYTSVNCNPPTQPYFDVLWICAVNLLQQFCTRFQPTRRVVRSVRASTAYC